MSQKGNGGPARLSCKVIRVGIWIRAENTDFLGFFSCLDCSAAAIFPWSSQGFTPIFRASGLGPVSAVSAFFRRASAVGEKRV